MATLLQIKSSLLQGADWLIGVTGVVYVLQAECGLSFRSVCIIKKCLGKRSDRGAIKLIQFSSISSNRHASDLQGVDDVDCSTFNNELLVPGCNAVCKEVH